MDKILRFIGILFFLLFIYSLVFLAWVATFSEPIPLIVKIPMVIVDVGITFLPLGFLYFLKKQEDLYG